MKDRLRRPTLSPVASAVGVALTMLVGVGVSGASEPNGDPGRYLTGDFHNHTPCSDGQISVQKLVNKSADTFGVDWFVMAGHGGGGTRNCTLPEDPTVWTPPEFPYVPGQGPATTWNASVGNDAIKGDGKATGFMHRWQSIQEFQYPLLEKMAEAKGKPIFIGLEQVVPGHEHNDVAIITGQLPEGGGGNAAAMAQWEYCFDRAESDTSRGGGQNWDCSVPGSALNADLHPTALALRNFGGKNYNSGTLGHLKTVESIKWMDAFHPDTSYFIPAHVERAGPFNPNGNNGYNVEHFRNFNNAAPRIAFGFEGGPGHQANGSRSYGSGAVGGGTYGGAGIYMGQVGGLWDAMLGEGRNFWIFNNSDYHARGMFGPDDPRSTNDQYPNEFNTTYVLVRNGGNPIPSPQDVVDALRSGNAYYVNGGLIDRMSFVVCTVQGNHTGAASGKGNWPHEEQIARAAEAGEGFFNPNCAQQGEKLEVKQGDDVLVMLVLRDPEGTNYSPYSFPNPSLLQIGVSQPLNQPVLDHVDLITGRVTGYIDPADTARYAGGLNSPAATNPSTAVVATFNEANWTEYEGGWKRMFYRLSNVRDSQYVRLRGTNMPAGVPNETDSLGNPLRDTLANNIVCSDAACPDHLPAVTGGRRLDFDVEAFTDIWFYSNPIYIEVEGSTKVAGVE